MKKTVLVLFLLLTLSLPVFAGLQGKVIMLNPGHGGGESGAVGPTGLVERDINLKVALYLRTMLEGAGATVIMTHTDDRDLDGTDHYSGTRDRYNRLKVGRDAEADVLIFIHHNSSVNTKAEQIEVYYMPKYFGPSKELADYLAITLKETMGFNSISTTMSQTVLNHATLPTIIGEGSYICNPKVEEWLRQDENLKKEAQGYFNGLQKFFEVGMPKVTAITPDANQKVTQENPIIVARVQTDGSSPINPSTVQVRIDNQVVASEYDAQTGVVRAKLQKGLANGVHQLLILGRNAAGIAAVPLDMPFYVDEKPAKIKIDAYPTFVPAGKDTVVKISGRVLDGDGQPIMDGNQVFFELDYEGAMDQPWVFTRNGYFVNYLRPLNNTDIVGIRIKCGAAMEEIVADFRSEDAYLSGIVKNALTGQGVKDIPIALIDAKGNTLKTQSDRDGSYYFSEVKAGEYKLVVNQSGYESINQTIKLPVHTSVTQNLQINSIAGGVLMNRKVIVNIAVEGSVVKAEAVMNTLKARLERAGATVLTVTAGADDLSTVKDINKLMGDFLISIKLTNTDGGLVYFYPKSEKYESLAKKLSIAGVELKTEGAKSRLVTFANTHSFILEISQKTAQDKVAEGLYQFIVEFFKGQK